MLQQTGGQTPPNERFLDYFAALSSVYLFEWATKLNARRSFHFFRQSLVFALVANKQARHKECIGVKVTCLARCSHALA